MFVATYICSIILSRQTFFNLRQAYFCHNKRGVLSRQTRVCRQTFVAPANDIKEAQVFPGQTAGVRNLQAFPGQTTKSQAHPCQTTKSDFFSPLLAYKGKSLSRSDCNVTNLSPLDNKGARRFWSDYREICLNAYYLQNISPV